MCYVNRFSHFTGKSLVTGPRRAAAGSGKRSLRPGPTCEGSSLKEGGETRSPVAPSPEKAALPDSKRQTAHAAHTRSEHGTGTRSRPRPRPGVTAPGQDGAALPRRPLHPGPPGEATGTRAAPPHTARLRPDAAGLDAASAPAGCLTAGEAAAALCLALSLPPRAGQAAGAWLRRVARIQLEPGLASPQLPARGRRKVTGAQAQVTPEWPERGHTASPGCEEPGKRSLLSLLSSRDSDEAPGSPQPPLVPVHVEPLVAFRSRVPVGAFLLPSRALCWVVRSLWTRKANVALCL